ncbi:MAG: peptidoglycan-binding protein [Bacteroidota bacterium]
MSVQTLIRRCATPSAQPTLQLNDSGPAVEALQRLLAESSRGYSQHYIYSNGNVIGTALEAIVKGFQFTVFLDDDGIVGPQTWKALCVDGPVDMPILRQGDGVNSTDETRTAIRRAQQRLEISLYYNGGVDGDFGPLTYAAVIRFQQANGLTADGIIGPLTWTALSRA